MKNRIDKILLGLLWLLAVALGASFWFKAKLGFNLFSSAHWDYLAYMQASQTPITPTFYTSLIITVIIAIAGLYLLVRPRFRKFKLQSMSAPQTATTPAPTVATLQAAPKPTPVPAPVAQPTPQIRPTPTPIVTKPIQRPPVASPAPATSAPSSARPPRLNIPLGALPQTPPPQLNIPTPSTPVAPSRNAVMEYPEIKEIFTNAGYTLKPAKKIEGTPIALFAIGTNENLWIGGVGVKTTELRASIDKLARVFSDTLDDIYININGFVIAAPDAATSEFQDILMFDSISALRTYMADFPNPPIPDDDDGNFEAYSDYIDTVLDYISKV